MPLKLSTGEGIVSADGYHLLSTVKRAKSRYSVGNFLSCTKLPSNRGKT